MPLFMHGELSHSLMSRKEKGKMMEKYNGMVYFHFMLYCMAEDMENKANTKLSNVGFLFIN